MNSRPRAQNNITHVCMWHSCLYVRSHRCTYIHTRDWLNLHTIMCVCGCGCVWVGGVGQRCQTWGHTAQCNSMKWLLLCQWGCPLCTAPLFSRSSNPGQFLNQVWQWAGWVTTETDTEPVHSAFMDVYALAYPEKGKQNLWGKKREDAESVFKAAEGKN